MVEGIFALSWWALIMIALVFTHVTIISVTIFLHRHQAHRALDLHPAVSHFFRFWLWLTTGMVTKEWVALHRKHHAKCETADDPHSPGWWLREIDVARVRRGRPAMTPALCRLAMCYWVLWKGVRKYSEHARNHALLKRYGKMTPDDFLERHLYARHVFLGVGLMLALDVVLFGTAGFFVWGIQMVWIPVFAAGVVNGVGHMYGYRNNDTPDASTNIVWLGIVIGGEELHNNHHAYPTSAMFAQLPREFDLGWVYVRLLRCLRLVRNVRIAPEIRVVPQHPVDTALCAIVAAHRWRFLGLLKSALGDLERDCAERWIGEFSAVWESQCALPEIVDRLARFCASAEGTDIAALRDFSLALRTLAVKS